jgi:hypothetical protein
MRYAIIALALLVAPAHASRVMNPPVEYVQVLLDYEAEEAVERTWRAVNSKRVPQRIIDNAYLSRWSATVICGEEDRGDSVNLVLFNTVTNVTVDSDDETFSSLWEAYCLQ